MTRAEALRQAVHASEYSLLLDGGDMLRYGNLAWPVLGRCPEWELAKRAGYTAMACGNREFHPWPVGLKAKAGSCPFPVLAANLNGNYPLPKSLKRFHIVTMSGLNVGLMGVMPAMTNTRQIEAWLQSVPASLRRVYMYLARTIAGAYRHEMPDEAVDAHMMKHGALADFWILLSHAGLEWDEAVAGRYEKLCVILSGHNHKAPDVRCLRGTALVHAGHHGCGYVELVFDTKGRVVRHWTYHSWSSER